MKPKENFFKAHYDWLVAALGIAALAASAVLLLPSLSRSPEAAVQQREAWLSSVKPAHDEVAPVPLGVLNGAQRLAKSPPVLNAIDPKLGSFLASEKRAFCKPGDPALKGCGKPIPVGAETCPFCAIAQKIEQKASADADNDGLPNDWETKYGLNPNDASDADKDSDNDGFTNAEEFAAKTDPKDKNSHPDYLDYLTVQGGLKQITLPFWFKSEMPIPGGHRYVFQNLKSRTAYDKTISVKNGEEIGKTGWVAGDYKKLSEERVIQGSGNKAKRPVDVSTVEVTSKADGRKLVLRVNERNIAVDTEATLAWDRFGGKNFTVKEGSEIDLNGSKYRVIALKSKAKNGCSVTLEDLSNKKQKTLETP